MIVVVGSSGSAVAAVRESTSAGATDTNAVAGTDPKLSALALASSSGSQLTGMTPDGAHLYVQTRAALNPGDSLANKVYDIFAGHARPIATGSFPRSLGATPDGSTVVFSTDSALTPDDTDTWGDIYVDGPTGIHLVSKLTTSTSTDFRAIADDGSAVIFRSHIPGIGDPAPYTGPDLYRWRAATDTIELLTPGTSDEPTFLAATPDLERFIFLSNDDLINHGASVADTIYERVDGDYVVRGTGPFRTADHDFTRVYFQSNSPFVPADVDGATDAYLWNTDDDTYELLTPDTTTGSGLGAVSDDVSKVLIWTNDALDPSDSDFLGDFYLMQADANPQLISGTWAGLGATANEDLSVLVVATSTGLAPQDLDGAADLYRVDLAHLDEPQLLTGPAVGEVIGAPLVLTLGISPDGNRIAYRTAEPLVPEDTDTKLDLYVWEPDEVTLVSPGTTDDVKSAFVASDVSRVVFSTRSHLVAEDTNVYGDSYLVDFDVTAPVPGITGPTGLIKSRAANLTFAATGDPARTECRIDGGAWTACPPTLSLTGLADGPHSAEINAWDVVGNLGTAIRSWTVDATGPTLKAPVVTVPIGQRMGTATVSVKLSWGASDAGSGIAVRTLQQQTDGGAWTTVAIPASGSSTARALQPGHLYRFRVSATDVAGNASGPAAGAAFQLVAAQESPPAVVYSGAWANATGTTYMAGGLRHASTAPSVASYAFTGKAVSWISTTGPTRGTAQVWVDGVHRATVSLQAPTTTTRATVFRAGWAASDSHTMEVRVVSGRVDVDAFVVIQ